MAAPLTISLLQLWKRLREALGALTSDGAL